MAEYKNEELGVRFTMPDKPTVRQMLRYRSLTPVPGRNPGLYEEYWYAVSELIDEWECEVVPEKGADLDALDDMRAVDIIAWVIHSGVGHMNRLGDVPKN